MVMMAQMIQGMGILKVYGLALVIRDLHFLSFHHRISLHFFVWCEMLTYAVLLDVLVVELMMMMMMMMMSLMIVMVRIPMVMLNLIVVVVI